MVNLISTPSLSANSLILNRFTVDDAEAVYNGWSRSQEVNRYMLRYDDSDFDKCKAYLENTIELYDISSINNWAIRNGGSLAGMISMNILPLHNRAEISFLVADGMRGKGIGYKALKIVLDYAKSILLHRLEAEVFEENSASRALLEKAGFIRESCAVDKVVKAGKYHNIITYVYIIDSK